MENELPARLAFLMPLISQCTGKPPSSFNFCTKPALTERAQLCPAGALTMSRHGQRHKREGRSSWDCRHGQGPTGFGKRKKKKKGETKQKSTLSSHNSSVFPGGAPCAGGFSGLFPQPSLGTRTLLCQGQKSLFHTLSELPAAWGVRSECSCSPGTEIPVPHPLSELPAAWGAVLGQGWGFGISQSCPGSLCIVASELCSFCLCWA